MEREQKIPGLVAHRGQMEHFPENSLIGMEQAIKAGACALEFDLQMGIDQQLILSHDAVTGRTADHPYNLLALPNDRRLQISVHEPQRFGNRYNPTPVPTLEEVLKLIEAFPHVHVFVELKEESLNHWGIKRMVDTTLEVIKPNRQQCTLISFDDTALRYCKSQSKLSIGWVLQEVTDDTFRRADPLKPEYLICNHTKLFPNQPLREGGWQWMLYDITDPVLALQWAQQGAALIETRDIATLLKHPQLQLNSCRDEV